MNPYFEQKKITPPRALLKGELFKLLANQPSLNLVFFV